MAKKERIVTLGDILKKGMEESTKRYSAKKGEQKPVTDEDLRHRLIAGDEKAYETLVVRYARPLYNAAFRILGDGEDAANAAQEALIQLYVSLPHNQLDLPLRLWLFRACRDQCLDTLRSRQALSNPETSDSPDFVQNVEETPSQPLPEEIRTRFDLQTAFSTAIANLSPHLREVVALRHTTDLTFTEIAKIVGRSERTVKMEFDQAKELLRRAIVTRRVQLDK